MDVTTKARHRERRTYYEHVVLYGAELLPVWCTGAGLFHALTAVTGLCTSMLFSLGHLSIVSACFLTVLGVYYASQRRATRMVRLYFLVYGLLHMICYLNYVRGKDTVDGVHLYLDAGTHLYAVVPELVFGLTGAPLAAYGMFIGSHILVSTCFYVHCALMSWPWAFVRAVVIHTLVLIATRAVHKRISASFKRFQAAETGAEPSAAPQVDKPQKPEAASVSSSCNTKGTTISQQSGAVQATEEGRSQHSAQEHESHAAADAAWGAPRGEEKAPKNSASMHQWPALAKRTLLRNGFGDGVPPHVLQCVQKGPKKYPMTHVLQANVKIQAKFTPSMFSPHALKLLASLLKVRDPLLWVRNSALREGSILVTLDVMQLAGILSNVQQEMHHQGPQPGGNMHAPDKGKESRAEAPGDECFRRLQQHVAAAGQAWLHNAGLENELEHGTLMSVQVLDCVHRFEWDANTASWEPCGSELLPFGCQHGITAHSPVVLLPSKSVVHGLGAGGSLSTTRLKAVDLELEVCTSPGQVVVGWEGGKQEQHVNAHFGVGAVQLLARMEGCHVPVTILECKPAAVVTDSPASEVPKQKQVLRVRMECKDQPCLVEFELWQQHLALAPACGVLLLPDSMAEVAGELDAWVRPMWDFKEHASETVDWDCAAAPDEGAAPESNDISEAFKRSRADWGFADFVADLGYWLEASNNAGPPNLGTQGQVELPGILGSSFYDTAQLWQSPSPSTRSAKAKQQQDEDHSILLRTGRQLLHQAISWGLCNVADLVLQGMLRKPFSLSFTELANGVPAHAHPNSFEEKMVGSFEDDESPSPRRSFEEELENCPESLLNLALLSRSPAMFGRVLEWGRTYGKPGFEWDWLFKDINEITPLQRMQVLCSTHPEMLEMALADTHAGPGLLACWLQRETHAAQQQGPIDKLPPQHSTPSTQAPTSPPSVSAADMAAAPAATQASSNRSATQASSSSSADVRHGHQAADLAAAPAATQASSSGAPNKASPTPANNHTIATEELAAPPLSSSSLLLKGGAAPAPRVCMLADTHQMRLPYFVWLLRSEVWGFRGGDAQAAGLRPQAACASGFCREVANLRSPVQQQQQQVANTHSPVQPQQQVDKENPPSNTAELSVISSESQYALSEVQYRAWAVHKAAPRLWKLSIVSTVLPLLLLASPLTIADSISEMEWRFQQPTAPVCCGLSLLSLTTLVLVSKLNTTVTPHTLQAWLSIAAVLRAVGYILLGSGILQGLERHPGFGFLGCIVLVWEAAASVVEQVHFFLGVAVRVPLIAIHATLWVKGAPSLAVPAVLLHSACAALWLAHSLKQRSTFVSMHAAAKARKAE